MEKTIRQSEEEKRRAIDSAKRLNSEYKPLKEQINQLREYVGLVKTDENNDDETLESFLRLVALVYKKWVWKSFNKILFY